LPLTHKAWAQGEISASAARTICRGITTGHEDIYAELEQTLVAYATTRKYREVDAIIRHYRNNADELDGIEPADRNGLHLSEVGGRWALNADLDAKDGATLNHAIDAALDMPTDTDTRTPAKRRADAIVRIAEFFLNYETLGLDGGERPHLTLTISCDEIMSWLPIRTLPNDPTDLAAFLTRTDREQILCDCNIARIILGPNSQPLDVGQEHRTVPRYLRRAIAQRDRHCRYPGCDRKPSWCEAHHVQPWWHAGPTHLNNLVLLCTFHHHVVHRHGWTNTLDGITYTIRNPDGTDISEPRLRWPRPPDPTLRARRREMPDRVPGHT
jgi:hypothetical protein